MMNSVRFKTFSLILAIGLAAWWTLAATPATAQGPGAAPMMEKPAAAPEERGAEASPRPSPLMPRPSAPPAIASVLWLLDSPVSNSGRLKTLIRELAEQNRWDWEIKLSISPDAELKRTDVIVASSDSVILDECKSWTNLAAEIITHKLPSAAVIDLAPRPGVT